MPNFRANLKIRKANLFTAVHQSLMSSEELFFVLTPNIDSVEKYNFAIYFNWLRLRTLSRFDI